MKETQTLTQLQFEPEDFPIAEQIAAALGYEQTAYTSTSALWGLFCLPENPATARRGQATKGGCLIKTRELGILFVQDVEDLGVQDLDLQNMTAEDGRRTARSIVARSHMVKP